MANLLFNKNTTLGTILTGDATSMPNLTFPVILLEDDAMLHPSFDMLLAAAWSKRPVEAGIFQLGFQSDFGSTFDSCASNMTLKHDGFFSPRKRWTPDGGTVWQTGIGWGEHAFVFTASGARLFRQLLNAPSWPDSVFCDSAPHWQTTSGSTCEFDMGGGAMCRTFPPSIRDGCAGCNGRSCKLYVASDIWLARQTAMLDRPQQVVHYSQQTRWPTRFEQVLRKKTAGGVLQCGLAIQGDLGSSISHVAGSHKMPKAKAWSAKSTEGPHADAERADARNAGVDKAENEARAECRDEWAYCAHEASKKCPRNKDAPLAFVAWSSEDRWWAANCKATCKLCHRPELCAYRPPWHNGEHRDGTVRLTRLARLTAHNRSSVSTIGSDCVRPLGGSSIRGRKFMVLVETLSPRSIARTIHQTVRSENMTCTARRSMLSWQLSNPDWRHVLWLDVDLELFFETHFAEYVDTFQQLQPVMRADLFRYLVVYKWAGAYADSDTLSLRPLTTVMGPALTACNRIHPPSAPRDLAAVLHDLAAAKDIRSLTSVAAKDAQSSEAIAQDWAIAVIALATTWLGARTTTECRLLGTLAAKATAMMLDRRTLPELMGCSRDQSTCHADLTSAGTKLGRNESHPILFVGEEMDITKTETGMTTDYRMPMQCAHVLHTASPLPPTAEVPLRPAQVRTMVVCRLGARASGAAARCADDPRAGADESPSARQRRDHGHESAREIHPLADRAVAVHRRYRQLQQQ